MSQMSARFDLIRPGTPLPVILQGATMEETNRKLHNLRKAASQYGRLHKMKLSVLTKAASRSGRTLTISVEVRT